MLSTSLLGVRMTSNSMPLTRRRKIRSRNISYHRKDRWNVAGIVKMIIKRIKESTNIGAFFSGRLLKVQVTFFARLFIMYDLFSSLVIMLNYVIWKREKRYRWSLIELTTISDFLRLALEHWFKYDCGVYDYVQRITLIPSFCSEI